MARDADTGGELPLGSLLAESVARLRAAGVEAPAREARMLLAHATGLDRDALLRLGRAAPVAAGTMRALVARRARREPLAFITGRQGFWSLDLLVSPATLIPRADTETVVEAALDEARRAGRTPRWLLDLGTGSGAILLALLSEWRDARGLGMDSSEAACRLARANARASGMGGRAMFACGDWAAAIGPGTRFDIVVSNPPYIETATLDELMPEVGGFEPTGALDGGADGLDAYRRLLPEIGRLLAPGGVAVFEIGRGQADPVASLARASGLAVRAARADLGGIARAVVLAPVETAPHR